MNQQAKPAGGTLRLLPAFVASLAFVLSAGAAMPRPEHPRPEVYRTNWTSLNGEWQFEFHAKADGETRGGQFIDLAVLCEP